MEYYIKEGEKPDGPYDMMAIIRKVRNGTVTEDTPIAASIFEEPKPAAEYPELKDFFNEDREHLQSIASLGAGPRRARNLRGLLRVGSDFLRQNHTAAVFSGLFMIGWLFVAMIFMFHNNIVLSLVGIACSYFLMGGYLYGILRFARGNPVTGGLIFGKMKETAVNMLVISVVVSMVMLPGVVLTNMLGQEMLIFSLPILFIFLLVVLTFLAFAPLLVTEKKRDFWDAMLGSMRVVTMNNGQYLGIIFALVALNFILLPLMPVVLPITMGALVDLFDEHFE